MRFRFLVVITFFSILPLVARCSRHQTVTLSPQQKQGYELDDQATQAAVAHDIVSAERYERAAIAADPNNMLFQYSLAKILESGGKKAEVRQIYQRIAFAAKGSPDTPAATYRTAAMHELVRFPSKR